LWLLPVLLITVIATALGGLLTRDLYADPPPASAPPVVQPSAPPSKQPGPATVQGTADAVGHPLYGTVQRLLQTYFDAINAKEYDKWASAVTSERLRQQPREKWQADYQSTQDGTIVVYRIETEVDGTARVLLRFTSTQDPSAGPTELPVGCIDWNVVWAFAVDDDNEWKLATGLASRSPQHEEC
jgi:hypothetical protein